MLTDLKTDYDQTVNFDYQVLGSTFCRLDCDSFIHSTHSSTVPSGCASCHFSTRCCCNNKQGFFFLPLSCFFQSQELACLIWEKEGGRAGSAAYPFSYQWTSGLDLHDSHNRFPVEYRLQLPYPVKIWKREPVKTRKANQAYE